MDGRLLGDGGTGASTYARALRLAAEAAGWRPGVLRASRREGAIARAGRWGIGATRRSLPLRDAGGGDLVGDDIFRLAQIHFGWRRRALELHSPGPPGIVHWTYPVPLRIAGWTNLYTVHDAIPLTHPTLTPIRSRRHRRLLAAIAPHAARFVTVSAAARADVVRAIGCDPGFVVDCGEAVVPIAPDPGTPAGLSRGGYFLVCGLIEPRKNLERLIAAHGRARTGLPLVLAGPNGWRAAPILAAAGAAPNVVRLPYQTRPALAALVRDARALLMPSLAEGFGLPVAEAMALGTPTLVSRDPALVETAGDAALIVDALSETALAEGIARLARDDTLCAGLGARGRARAGTFTGDAFAGRLAGLYRSLVAASS